MSTSDNTKSKSALIWLRINSVCHILLANNRPLGVLITIPRITQPPYYGEPDFYYYHNHENHKYSVPALNIQGALSRVIKEFYTHIEIEDV